MTNGLAVSVLDLVGMHPGEGAGPAIARSVDLAQHVEQWGYKRFWLAEHHSIDGLACSATAVLVGHVASATRAIRVGSGGIMLPNHAPLVVAEQFGTLATLFPNRIDLGLGRAPGTDVLTARALRRDLATSAEHFPQDVMELQGYFEPSIPGQGIRAIPGEGLRVPLWILGSSLFGASLAAALGLPFAFASHFAPDALMAALAIYRSRFKASRQLQQPYVMVAANVVAAASDAEAQFLFTSLQQAFLRLRRGEPGPLPPPVLSIDAMSNEVKRAGLTQALECSFVGSVATVTRQLQAFLTRTGANELIISGHIYDHQARLRSFELAADARDALAVEP